MEEFCENLVVIKKNGAKIVSFITVWLAAALIIAASVYFWAYLGSIAILVSAGAVAGAVFLSRKFTVEYETIVTNGEIDVDKIIAKSSRTRIISFSASDITAVSHFNPGLPIKKGTLMFCNASDSDVYVVNVNHKKRGKVVIILQITEKMKKQMIPFMDKLIVREVFS